MKEPGIFSVFFEVQEFEEDQPSTSCQGNKSNSNQQDEEEGEEEEEWETVDRLPFTYQSPIVREKLKRAKEAGMDVEYLPYTLGNQGRNMRIKRKVNKILQRKRLEKINREGFCREMPEEHNKRRGWL